MPQMAPINWLSMFMMFSLTFVLFCLMNYYSMLPPSSEKSKQYKIYLNSLGWKW